MDVVLSQHLPELTAVKAHYAIPFERYAVSLFHLVTTEPGQLAADTASYFDALEISGLNYVMVYPNNDPGSSIILERMQQYRDAGWCRIFPSVRFEAFLTPAPTCGFHYRQFERRDPGGPVLRRTNHQYRQPAVHAQQR